MTNGKFSVLYILRRIHDKIRVNYPALNISKTDRSNQSRQMDGQKRKIMLNWLDLSRTFCWVKLVKSFVGGASTHLLLLLLLLLTILHRHKNMFAVDKAMCPIPPSISFVPFCLVTYFTHPPSQRLPAPSTITRSVHMI